MKRVVLMLALALVIPAFAMAGAFTYNTTGQFSCVLPCVATNSATPGGNSTVVTGGETLTFTSKASTNGNTPTGATFGTFTFDASGPVANFAGVGFTVSLFQTAPGAGNHDFVGSVAGTLGNNSSGLYWIANNPTSWSFTTGGTTTVYALSFTNKNDPGACNGLDNCVVLGNSSASIQAFVTQVPEPASILMLGTGLSGLAGLVRRRLKK